MTPLMMCTVLVFGLASGQDVDRPRYGTPSDLHGLTRLYVDTGTDMKAHDRIVRELRASGIALELVNDAADAEMLMEFGATVERRVGGWVTNNLRDKNGKPQTSVTTTTEKKVQNGEGTIYVVQNGRLVVVESFSDEKGSFLEREPSTNFARDFLRLYRAANGLTEKR